MLYPIRPQGGITERMMAHRADVKLLGNYVNQVCKCRSYFPDVPFLMGFEFGGQFVSFKKFR